MAQGKYKLVNRKTGRILGFLIALNSIELVIQLNPSHIRHIPIKNSAKYAIIKEK